MDLGTRQLAIEAYRRFTASSAPSFLGRIGDMLATRFDKQLAFINHPARRKAGLCTRRAGKTELVPAYLLKAAREHPEAVCIYVAPTLRRARALMWSHLKRFNKKFGFGGKPNETLLTLTLPNGAEVRLDGADKLNDADKKRGDKLALVIIDEASVYRPEVLRALVDDVFGPALEDLQGTICLLGTPGVVCAGIWFEISRHEVDQRELGWVLFEWSVLDNPHMAHMVERLPALKLERGWADDDPTYLREWRGRWVLDTGALFYRYLEARNSYDGVLPPGHSWRYVVGADVGFDDAYADVVWAFAPTLRELYEVESFKRANWIPTQWAERLRQLREKYRPIKMVIDEGGLGKAIAEEFRQRHGLPVEAAEKTKKAAFVKLLNDDLVAGWVRVRKGSVLAAEWRVLPKDPDDPTVEDSRFENHAADGGLYGWREARHFVGVVRPPEPERGTPEWEKAEQERREAALVQQLHARAHEDDDLFGVSDDAGDDYWGFSNAA